MRPDRHKFMGDAPTREDGVSDSSATHAPVVCRSSPPISPKSRLSSNGVGGSTLPATAAFPASGKPIKRPSFTAAQRLATFEAFGAMVCCQGDGCEAVVRIKGCDIDHHLAIVNGGTHELSNWRPLCDPCHAKKSAREHIGNCRAKRLAVARAVHDAVKRGEHVRPASRIRGRGFQKHPTLKVQFGTGKVVPRG